MKSKLATAFAVVAIAGCGGGDESEPRAKAPAANHGARNRPGEERSNIDTFIAKADEICASFNDRWVGVPEATAEYYRDWNQSNADLEALDAPARISTEWDRYLAALEQQLRFTEAEKGPELKQAYEQKEKAAQELGLTDCSSR